MRGFREILTPKKNFAITSRNIKQKMITVLKIQRFGNFKKFFDKIWTSKEFLVLKFAVINTQEFDRSSFKEIRNQWKIFHEILEVEEF